jgi:hypothetical protein
VAENKHLNPSGPLTVSLELLWCREDPKLRVRKDAPLRTSYFGRSSCPQVVCSEGEGWRVSERDDEDTLSCEYFEY